MEDLTCLKMSETEPVSKLVDSKYQLDNQIKNSSKLEFMRLVEEKTKTFEMKSKTSKVVMMVDDDLDSSAITKNKKKLNKSLNDSYISCDHNNSLLLKNESSFDVDNFKLEDFEFLQEIKKTSNKLRTILILMYNSFCSKFQHTINESYLSNPSSSFKKESNVLNVEIQHQHSKYSNSFSIYKLEDLYLDQFGVHKKKGKRISNCLNAQIRRKLTN